MEFLIIVAVIVVFAILIRRLGSLGKEIREMKEQVGVLLDMARAQHLRDIAEAKRTDTVEEENDAEESAVAETSDPAESAAVLAESLDDAPTSDIIKVNPPAEPEEPAREHLTPPPVPQEETSLVAEISSPEIETSHEPSALETKAREILAKIWNWIVVGEEHRPSNVTMEYAVATTWLLRLGVLFLVVGIGFFLNYSIAEGYIGPVGKVALTAAAGAGLLLGGLKLFRGRYDLLGQGLTGAGIITLYFTFFTSQGLGLTGPVVTFSFMALITVVAGLLAVRFRSLLVAVLGLIGGYLTPFLIETDQPSLHALLAYLLVLGLGVFGVAMRREWRLLHYLSFLATWLHMGLIIEKAYQPSLLWTFLPFAVAFFLLFSTITFIYQLIQRKQATLLELLFLVLNAAVFVVAAGHLIDEATSRKWLALVTSGLSAFYIAHAQMFLRRKILDRGLLLTFLGLASVFAALTLPILLSGAWLTASWSLLALMTLWIGLRLGTQFLAHLALLLFAFVVFRLFVIDLNVEYLGDEGTLSNLEAFKAMGRRIIVLGIPIASLLAAGNLLRTQKTPTGKPSLVSSKNDTPVRFSFGPIAQTLFWVVIGAAFFFLHFEIHKTISAVYAPLQSALHTIVFLGLLYLLLTRYRSQKHVALLTIFWVFVSLLLAKLLVIDLAFSRITADMSYALQPFASGLLMRLLNFGLVIAFLIWVWRQGTQSSNDTSPNPRVLAWLSLGSFFLFSSLEVWTFWTHTSASFRTSGISIYWGVFALAMLFYGISKNSAVVRRVGLAMIAIVAAKVFLIDLAGLGQLPRIIAFIVLGILVLVCSFLYLKYRHRFSPEELTDSKNSQDHEAP